MAVNQYSKEELLSRLSHRPAYIVNRNIEVGESAKPSFSKIQREPQSSAGLFDTLPLELFQATLDHLDLQSLSRLSRVCLRAKVVVESLRAYKDLVRVAGHIFPTLRNTELLGFHPVATLHKTLCSDKCVSCGLYGAFLHLLSAERCCYACFTCNPGLWVIPLDFASAYFKLTMEQLTTLPTMRHPLEGSNSIIPRPQRTLTIVRAAKELAIQNQGDAYPMARTKPATRNALLYQNAPLRCPRHEITFWAACEGMQPDNCLYEGMGTVAFPSLIGNKVENGLWCGGCAHTYGLIITRQLDRDVLSRLAPPDCNLLQFARDLKYRAMSEAEFLEHAQHCFGAAKAMAQPWVGFVGI
ncbi:hypothetical protein DM02DRAFT_92617 [Periconia macrospinosa]|uniref:F-box domain-containing protein n=1 Tax=Periconia macrospinosa TaxID=97972 RepID=A0A2V1DIZ3_9PLEO|nr:hypothetical protein DM02DRAFT_92617 [Periconia macrospinosa]